MGSSRPTDRSLGEATFLPQWMKHRLDTRFDYSDSSFSPPADDNFFFIRYPNYQKENVASVAANSKESFRSISEVLNNKSEKGNLINQSENSTYKEVKNIDFSKHPRSCQPFIPVAAETVKEPKIIVANKPKVKYQTTDDDFCDTKTSECGRSIVHVANQIMSSKFGKSSSSDSSSTTQDKSDSNVQQQQNNQRKASKSLPATPLASPSVTPEGSPKSRRRVYGNRFFTGAFVPDNNGERQHHQKNGWLLSSILGQSRELITPKIEEEDEQSGPDPVPTTRALSRKKSISSQNLTYVGKEDNNNKQQQQPLQDPVHVNVLQPKPSELREMNFWSPTSM